MEIDGWSRARWRVLSRSRVSGTLERDESRLEGSVSSRGGLEQDGEFRLARGLAAPSSQTRLASFPGNGTGRPWTVARLGVLGRGLGWSWREFVDFWAKISPQIGEPLI